jgi:hypothetical protein
MIEWWVCRGPKRTDNALTARENEYAPTQELHHAVGFELTQ